MKTARSRYAVLLLVLLAGVSALHAESAVLTAPEIIVVPSGSLQLRALLWRPAGSGPFPAVLFNHGRGDTPQQDGRLEGLTKLGALFSSHGYMFMALFRRGEGLSADQGVFIGELLERERAAKGDEAANKLQLQLLTSDHLHDVLAGLAVLRALPGVDARRIAVVGHSFGGSLALLAAEREKSLQAVVSFAGAAGSWEHSEDLRERLTAAAGRLPVPVLLVYASNDFSLAPAKALDAEMTRRRRIHRLELFPSFGRTAAQAHDLVYLAPAKWESAVFAFLDKSMKR